MGFTIGSGGLSAEWIANCTGGTVYTYSNGYKIKSDLCAEDSVIRGVGIDCASVHVVAAVFVAVKLDKPVVPYGQLHI